jgi:hypothetical protein
MCRETAGRCLSVCLGSDRAFRNDLDSKGLANLLVDLPCCFSVCLLNTVETLYHCSACDLQSDIIAQSENKRKAVRNFADEFDCPLVFVLKSTSAASSFCTAQANTQEFRVVRACLSTRPSDSHSLLIDSLVQFKPAHSPSHFHSCLAAQAPLCVTRALPQSGHHTPLPLTMQLTY